MVLGVGLVSAVLLAKKQPNYKTRLQQLQLKLKTKPIYRCILYQIPTKRIFSIIIIIAFIFFFNYFQETYFIELLASHTSKNSESSQKSLFQLTEKYRKLETILKWVKILYLLMTIALISDLKFKILVVSPNLIEIKQYNRKNFGRVKSIYWKPQQNKLKIVAKGAQKFTHYTQHFSIEVADEKKLQFQTILNRSDIFHSRKTIIQMSSVLKIKPDLRIY